MMRTPRSGALIVCAGLAVALVAVVILGSHEARSQETKKSTKAGPLDGVWKLVAQKNAETQEFQKLPAGTEMTKFVTGDRYVWVVVREGRIGASLGGKFSVDGDKYSETIDYCLGENLAAAVGKKFEFKWKLDGNTWLHSGVINIGGAEIKVDEKWERCE